MIRVLHTLLAAIWQSGTIPFWLENGAGHPYLKREREPSGLQRLLQCHIAQGLRQGACPFVSHADWKLFAEAGETWVVRVHTLVSQ